MLCIHHAKTVHHAKTIHHAKTVHHTKTIYRAIEWNLITIYGGNPVSYPDFMSVHHGKAIQHWNPFCNRYRVSERSTFEFGDKTIFNPNLCFIYQGKTIDNLVQLHKG